MYDVAQPVREAAVVLCHGAPCTFAHLRPHALLPQGTTTKEMDVSLMVDCANESCTPEGIVTQIRAKVPSATVPRLVQLGSVNWVDLSNTSSNNDDGNAIIVRNPTPGCAACATDVLKNYDFKP